MPPTYNVPAHPGAVSPEVSARMSRLRRRDNDREREVRRLLHAAGYRFRVAYPVPGNRRRTIDIAFTRVRVAVFLDGCFWHGCPEHGTRPSSNAAWWSAKLEANRLRDRDTDRVLEAQGWEVARFWEHEPAAGVAGRLMAVVDRRRGGDAPREVAPPG